MKELTKIGEAMGAYAMSTATGNTVIFNTELVTPKIINIIEYLLNKGIVHEKAAEEELGSGIFSIVFQNEVIKDLSPTGNVWEYIDFARCAVCSLRTCTDIAIDRLLLDPEMDRTNTLNILTSIWMNIIGGFLHEMKHADQFLRLNESIATLPDEAKDCIEDEADSYAEKMLITLAKEVDIEPDLPAEIKQYVAKRMKELELEKDQKEEVLTLIEDQKYLLENNITWRNFAPEEIEEDETKTDGSKPELKTFKQYWHFLSADALDDPSWGVNTINDHTIVLTPVQNPAENSENCYDDMPDPEESTFQQPVQQPVQPTYQQPVYQQPAQQPAQQQNPWNQPQGQYQTQQPQGQVYNQQVYNQSPQVQAGQGAYEKPDIPASEFQAVVNNLYRKIAHHIFDECIFNSLQGPQAPIFWQADKITKPIQLTNDENKIVKEMSCIDENGAIKGGVIVNGFIKGKFMDRDRRLVGYELTMSDEYGNQMVRKFLPQNPWRINPTTGQYSKTAVMAQQGNRIIWILDPMNKTQQQFSRRLLNGEYQSNFGGQWATVQDHSNC